MPQGFRYQKISFEHLNNYLTSEIQVYSDDAKIEWKLINNEPHWKSFDSEWRVGNPSPMSQWYIKVLSESCDNVNSPKHYHTGPFEVIKVLKAWNITDFHLGNVIKYVARCGSKHDEPLEDLKKAAWYLNDKIKELENK